MTKFSDLRGKTVIDWEGSIVGKIKDIDINLINYSVQSIIVHKGFFKHDTKIMTEYIDKFEGNNVFLKISPVNKLIGRKVFDSDGHDMGRIIDVIRVGETNVLEEIVVKTKIVLTKDRGAYENERPLPGEKTPAGSIRVTAESPLMMPSSDIDEEMTESATETFKEEIRVSSKYIDSVGDHITLNVTKEELIAQIF